MELLVCLSCGCWEAEWHQEPVLEETAQEASRDGAESNLPDGTGSALGPTHTQLATLRSCLSSM